MKNKNLSSLSKKWFQPNLEKSLLLKSSSSSDLNLNFDKIIGIDQSFLVISQMQSILFMERKTGEIKNKIDFNNSTSDYNLFGGKSYGQYSLFNANGNYLEIYRIGGELVNQRFSYVFNSKIKNVLAYPNDEFLVMLNSNNQTGLFDIQKVFFIYLDSLIFKFLGKKFFYDQ